MRQFHTVQENEHTWSVLNYIYRKQLRPDSAKYACFLLNLSDEADHDFTRYKYIWNEASLKVAVDGSANFLADRNIINSSDLVTGDFDSIDPTLLEELRSGRKSRKLMTHRYKQNESAPPQVIETPSQKATDFTKALWAAMHLSQNIHFYLALYYSDGSRIDHLFGLVNTLHLVHKNITLVNIRSNTVSWLLKPGTHNIQKPRGRELCSLVPFTGPTEVKTKGLEYDVGGSNSTLSFGGLISTSNLCQANCENIIVETNRELLWSIDICASSENESTER